MKQLAQYQDGRLELQDVPRPTAPPGGILVRTTHSVISVGTERMQVEQARMNLFQKARARPDQVRNVLDTARNLGWRSALEKVRNRLETPTPLGYSAAGIVEAVDPGHTRFRVGDRVACGGAECVFHAEYIAVPDLLAARVPEGVENWQAAYTTLASVALQAVRQLDRSLGDRVLVLGQGLVGLLVTALLRAHGARVMAADVAAGKGVFSLALGAERFVIPDEVVMPEALRLWTEGWGVDGVILATATGSNAPVEQAIQALRDRGRVVVVGNTNVELNWKSAYEKEIEVRYSRSYGPGRYDPAYEFGGADYPIGYVRWTEQRNFEACLHLMLSGAIDLGRLTTRRAPFSTAPEIYQDLLSGHGNEIGVVLEYPTAPLPQTDAIPPRTGPGTASAPAKRDQPSVPAAARLAQPISRVDVIGAGNFARTMLLPHLQGCVPLGTIVNATALSANHVKTKFGFAAASTDPAFLLGPGSAGAPGAVLIATRHHLHAPIVLAALAGGHHVFVEKPLCLTRAELEQIDRAVAAGTATVQVGFNRRFARSSAVLKQLLEETPGPKSGSFRVNAGPLDPAHWYANHAESGGRILGEACHFLDYFCFLFGHPPVRVSAQAIWPVRGRLPFPDSVSAQVEFADGSCGQLIYSAEGDPAWSKEQVTVFAAGAVAELTNFQELRVQRGRQRTSESFKGKGHAEEMVAWTAFLRGEAPHPLPYAQSRQSMLLTFAVLESIQQAATVTVNL